MFRLLKTPSSGGPLSLEKSQEKCPSLEVCFLWKPGKLESVQREKSRKAVVQGHLCRRVAFPTGRGFRDPGTAHPTDETKEPTERTETTPEGFRAFRGFPCSVDGRRSMRQPGRFPGFPALPVQSGVGTVRYWRSSRVRISTVSGTFVTLPMPSCAWAMARRGACGPT